MRVRVRRIRGREGMGGEDGGERGQRPIGKVTG